MIIIILIHFYHYDHYHFDTVIVGNYMLLMSTDQLYQSRGAVVAFLKSIMGIAVKDLQSRKISNPDDLPPIPGTVALFCL